MPRVVTLVPYRPSNDRQRWLWDCTLPYLEELGFPVYVGEPNGEDWSRSQACNSAARAAGDWEVALIGDCDTIPDESSIRRAIAWVLDTGGAARPHMERTMLNEEGTLTFIRRGPKYLIPKKHYARQWPGGGLLVLTREAWDRVGGYDESYVGWGYEDTDLNLKLLRHAAWNRLPGRAWHLWHPVDANTPRRQNVQRYQRNLMQYGKEIAEWAQDKGLKSPKEVL